MMEKDVRPIAVLPVIAIYKLYSRVLYMLAETTCTTNAGSSTRHTRRCLSCDNWWRRRGNGRRHTCS